MMFKNIYFKYDQNIFNKNILKKVSQLPLNKKYNK